MNAKSHALKATRAALMGTAGLALCAPLLLQAATPLTTVHPSWTLYNLRPSQTSSFRPMVGGMDFLSDGRLVIGHWGGTRTACCPSNTNFGGRQYTGKIYILSGVTGTTPSVVIDSSFATGLEDVMGLTVIRDRKSTRLNSSH